MVQGPWLTDSGGGGASGPVVVPSPPPPAAVVQWRVAFSIAMWQHFVGGGGEVRISEVCLKEPTACAVQEWYQDNDKMDEFRQQRHVYDLGFVANWKEVLFPPIINRPASDKKKKKKKKA